MPDLGWFRDAHNQTLTAFFSHSSLLPVLAGCDARTARHPVLDQHPHWGLQHSQDAEKVRQRYWKVKAEAKAERKKVRSSLNLDLDLSLPTRCGPAGRPSDSRCHTTVCWRLVTC